MRLPVNMSGTKVDSVVQDTCSVARLTASSGLSFDHSIHYLVCGRGAPAGLTRQCGLSLRTCSVSVRMLEILLSGTIGVWAFFFVHLGEE